MSPLKRVMVSIAVLLVLMISALLISWRVQERALGDALVSDVTATLARPIERTPSLEAPKHENGFACLSAAIDAMPSDLTPFDFKDQAAFQEILDAGVVPDAVAPAFAAVQPWAESVRSCADSARLAYVPEVSPFAPLDDAKNRPRSLALTALARITRVQARLLAAEQRWGEVAQRCAGTLEIAFDYGHLNLIGAMVSAAVLSQLARPCAEALQRLPPESRPPIAERFARLPSRLVSNVEMLELERQVATLSTYRSFLSEEQREKLPPGDDWLRDVLDEPAVRLTLPRLWSRWDRALRQLVAAARAPGAEREDASRAVDEVFDQWWTPGLLSTQPNYEKFCLRNDESAALLTVLIELAAGREVTLSPQLVKTAEGLEFTKSGGGEKLIIPLVH